MQKIVSIQGMRLSDEKTIKSGISSIELMQRAGGKLCQFIIERFPQLLKSENNFLVTIICGKGSNGGDGYVLAIELAKKHIPYKIIMMDLPTKSSLHFYNLCNGLNSHIVEYSDSINFSNGIIVDCIFGTGFKSQFLSCKYVNIINKINNSENIVISCDIPSGLNGDNGLISGCAVKANYTVAIGSKKSGYFLNDGKDYCGQIECVDIGIECADEQIYLIDVEDVNLFQPRKNNSSKFDYGRCAIIGGSSEYTGAVILSSLAEASLRCGVGFSYVYTNNIASKIIRCKLPESIVKECDYNSKFEYLNDLKKVDAVAVGIGFGRSEFSESTVNMLIANLNKKLIIDGDGISIANKELFKSTKAEIIITPHIYEFAKISNYNIDDIKTNPLFYAKQFAKEYGIIVLLKGSTMIVTDGNDVYLVDNGSPCLAKGGTGDVLTGICVGLMAYNSTIESAYCAGYLLAKSGNIAREKTSEFSVLATDIVAEIGSAIRYVIDKNNKRIFSVSN